MTFNTPNLNSIIETLVNNNSLISSLIDNGAIIQRQDVVQQYDPSILEESILEANILNLSRMYELAELIFANEEHIRENSIWQLTAEKFLFNDILLIFDIQKAEDLMFQNIFYCYKYCYISSFFQNNKEKFLPAVDLETIKENPAADAFLDSLMKEFDKIDRMLYETKDYIEYDKIPWKYIVYLTQLLGLEKDFLDFDDSEEAFYRELAKNILDIYRVKGTNYSFELFFNFLGISIEIKEFFFDRRYLYAKYPPTNSETDCADMYNKDFYLTTINPSYNLNSSFANNEVVTLKDFTEQQSLLDFEEKAREYGLEAVLGYSNYDKNGNKYTGNVYKYFKTNYIYYYASSKVAGANLTSKQITAISKYLDFLTPIFVLRDIKTVAYVASDKDSIGFNGDGTRKPNASGEYEGFQMLDSEVWEGSKINKYLYLNNNGEYVKKHVDGSEEIYYNSLPKTNLSSEKKKFRQPVGISFLNVHASKYIGFENGVYVDGAARVALYEIEKNTEGEEEKKEYYYTTPPTVSSNIAKSQTIYTVRKTNTTGGITGRKNKNGLENTLKCKIRDNKFKTKINYVIDTDLENTDINKYVLNTDINSCSWQEYLLPFESVEVTIPNSLSTNIVKLLQVFNVVALVGNDLSGSSEEVKYLNSSKIEISDLKKYLVLGDYYITNYSNKIKLYRCSYVNKKKWFLRKTFADNDINNNIPLSSNYKIVGNFSSAIKDFFAICKKSDSEITVWSNFYKISGKYYSPYLCYTEEYNVDKAKSENPNVGDTCFEGKVIEYTNTNYEENDVKNNKREIYFWNKKVGELIYNKNSGKLYKIENYGPSGIKEINFFGNIQKEGEDYYIYEYDDSWYGYSEEGDEQDFVFYNIKHRIDWNVLGINNKYISRPNKEYTDEQYYKDTELIIPGTVSQKYSVKNRLIKDIWEKTFDHFPDDVEEEFKKTISTDANVNIQNTFSYFYEFLEAGKDPSSLIDLMKQQTKREVYQYVVKKSSAADRYRELRELGYDEYYSFGEYDLPEGFYNKDSLTISNISNFTKVVYAGKIIAKARSSYKENSELKDHYNRYLTIFFQMLDLLENYKKGNLDEYLKNYFYEELLYRYRENFIYDGEGLKIDSKNNDYFFGLPILREKLNGKAGTFKAPRTLNSQYNSLGSNSYSAIKVPLDSVKYTRVSDGSTDIQFSFTMKDWYSNSKEMFTITTVNDIILQGFSRNIAEKINEEINKEYLRSFTPKIFIDKNISGSALMSNLKFFKDDIEQDVYENYIYKMFYIKNNKETEINSLEDGARKIYNYSFSSWKEEKTEIKNEILQDIYSNSNIRITINNNSSNKYPNLKKYRNVLSTETRVSVPKKISDCLGASGVTLIKRGELDVGYITLKYFSQQFKDNIISVPKSIEWIEKKNGVENEYTTYGDDRDFTAVTINRRLKNDPVYAENYVNAIRNKNNNYSVIDKDTSKAIENPRLYVKGFAYSLNDLDSGRIKTSDVSYISDSKGKRLSFPKIVKTNFDKFAERSVDKSGDIILKLKNFTVSDVKQIVISFIVSLIKVMFQNIYMFIDINTISYIKKFTYFNNVDIKTSNKIKNYFLKRVDGQEKNIKIETTDIERLGRYFNSGSGIETTTTSYYNINIDKIIKKLVAWCTLTYSIGKNRIGKHILIKTIDIKTKIINNRNIIGKSFRKIEIIIETKLSIKKQRVGKFFKKSNVNTKFSIKKLKILNKFINIIGERFIIKENYRINKFYKLNRNVVVLNKVNGIKFGMFKAVSTVKKNS